MARIVWFLTLSLAVEAAEDDPRAALQRSILTGVDDATVGFMIVADPSAVRPITVSPTTTGTIIFCVAQHSRPPPAAPPSKTQMQLKNLTGFFVMWCLDRSEVKPR
jgi:hypothetical protein